MHVKRAALRGGAKFLNGDSKRSFLELEWCPAEVTVRIEQSILAVGETGGLTLQTFGQDSKRPLLNGRPVARIFFYKHWLVRQEIGSAESAPAEPHLDR
jgi:hypothetical protein